MGKVGSKSVVLGCFTCNTDAENMPRKCNFCGTDSEFIESLYCFKCGSRLYGEEERSRIRTPDVPGDGSRRIGTITGSHQEPQNYQKEMLDGEYTSLNEAVKKQLRELSPTGSGLDEGITRRRRSETPSESRSENSISSVTPLFPPKFTLDHINVNTRRFSTTTHARKISHKEGLDHDLIQLVREKTDIEDLRDLLMATPKEIEIICNQMELTLSQKLRFRRALQEHMTPQPFLFSEEAVIEELEDMGWERKQAPPMPELLQSPSSRLPLVTPPQLLNQTPRAVKESFPTVNSIFQNDVKYEAKEDLKDELEDEFVQVGDWIRCRDSDEDPWLSGKVISIAPIFILPQGWNHAKAFSQMEFVANDMGMSKSRSDKKRTEKTELDQDDQNDSEMVVSDNESLKLDTVSSEVEYVKEVGYLGYE